MILNESKKNNLPENTDIKKPNKEKYDFILQLITSLGIGGLITGICVGGFITGYSFESLYGNYLGTAYVLASNGLVGCYVGYLLIPSIFICIASIPFYLIGRYFRKK